MYTLEELEEEHKRKRSVPEAVPDLSSFATEHHWAPLPRTLSQEAIKILEERAKRRAGKL